MAQGEPVQELPVPLRDAARQRRPGDRRQILDQPGHAIAPQGLHAAIHEPDARHRLARQEPQHHVLVIALEVHALEAVEPGLRQMLDHALQIGAAIDVVAEIDDHSSRGPRAGGVGPYFIVEAEQQIEPTVNIADGIDPGVGSRGGHRDNLKFGDFSIADAHYSGYSEPVRQPGPAAGRP